MERKVKWGVLGYARIARNSVIPAIVKASNSEFYAIASRDEGRLKECVKEFNCPKAYRSYDELLEDPEVQAVYIPLPNSFHKEWTIKAARKGKHVLCEKPIALNTAECMEMIDECRKNNVKLMEAFMYRYTDKTKKVKQLIDSGIIGEVRHINSTFGFFLERENDVRLDRALGGGSLYDVGCYPINFIGMVLGASPVSMSAECILQNGVDVGFSAVLKYENGVLCTINSWFNAHSHLKSEIIGTKGVIEVPETFFGTPLPITVTTSEGRKEIEVEESDRYLLEVEDFADAIISGREPMFSLEETVRNMKIIDQLLDIAYNK